MKWLSEYLPTNFLSIKYFILYTILQLFLLLWVPVQLVEGLNTWDISSQQVSRGLSVTTSGMTCTLTSCKQLMSSVLIAAHSDKSDCFTSYVAQCCMVPPITSSFLKCNKDGFISGLLLHNTCYSSFKNFSVFATIIFIKFSKNPQSNSPVSLLSLTWATWKWPNSNNNTAGLGYILVKSQFSSYRSIATKWHQRWRKCFWIRLNWPCRIMFLPHFTVFSSAFWLLSLAFYDKYFLQDSTALILEPTCLVHIKELHLLF